MDKNDFLNKIKGGLIVSCQAEGDEPLNSPEILAALSRAAVAGGAVAIRAERPDNLIAIKNAVDVPIIGLYKKKYPDSDVYITPTLQDAKDVLAIGVNVVAMDATFRQRPNGEKLEKIVTTLKAEDNSILMADVSTVDEGMRAVQLGFDLIGTTLAGYTEQSKDRFKSDEPDFDLLSELIARLNGHVPVIAEGRIWTPEQVCQALEIGAFAVVVGSAITRPTVITKRMDDAVKHYQRSRNSYAIGIDLGGTKTKIALITNKDKIIKQKTFQTPWDQGTGKVVSNIKSNLKSNFLESLNQISAIGIAASGRVDYQRNIVSDGVPLASDYFNYPIADELSQEFRLPVLLENDANAAALAEYNGLKFPRPQRMLFMTIGTGIGGGIIVDGKLLKGNGHAGEIGHICVDKSSDELCGCGRTGCLELMVSRKRMEEEFQSLISQQEVALPKNFETVDTDAIIEFIRTEQPDVISIFNQQMEYLAIGLDNVSNIIDPELIVIGGEFSKLGILLIEAVQKRMKTKVNIRISMYGNNAGVIGASQLALDNFV